MGVPWPRPYAPMTVLIMPAQPTSEGLSRVHLRPHCTAAEYLRRLDAEDAADAAAAATSSVLGRAVAMTMAAEEAAEKVAAADKDPAGAGAGEGRTRRG